MQAGSPLSTMKVIWAGIFGSQFIYYFVLKMITSTAGESSAGSLFNSPLDFVFALLAVSVFVASFIVPNIIYRAARKPVSSGEQLDFEAMAGSWMVPFIIRLAMIEGIALLGLVLGIIRKNDLAILPFLALSTLAFLIVFPTKERITSSFKS